MSSSLYGDAHPRKVRARGCAPPFSREQLGAVAAQLCATALTVVFLCLYVAWGGWLALSLALYCAPAAASFAAWAYCVSVDPSAPGGVPCVCMRRGAGVSRYCRTCGKSVPGLDHHCAWLNQCVGEENYKHFIFFLAVRGSQRPSPHSPL